MQFKFNFEGLNESQFLMDEIQMANLEINKLRKSFFVRFGFLEKEIMELKKEVYSKRKENIEYLPIFEYLERKENVS